MNDAEKQRLRRTNAVMQGISRTLLWIVLLFAVLGIALRIMLWVKGVKL